MEYLDIYVENKKRFSNAAFYILRQALLRFKDNEVSINIQVLEKPDKSLVSANNAFMHVDLTVLPEPFTLVHTLYSKCINGNVRSIAKDLYSQVILEKDEEYDGPVIIKTILNHKGLPELIFDIQNGVYGPFGNMRRRKLIRLHCPEYRVCETIEEVSSAIWDNPKLIVEKFIPGNIDLPIVKYRHDFFLDVELNTRSTFNSLLCHPDKLVNIEYIDEVPCEITDLRNKLNLEFGSIDFFVIDGVIFITDANKTTTVTMDWIEDHPRINRFLDNVSDRLLEYVRT